MSQEEYPVEEYPRYEMLIGGQSVVLPFYLVVKLMRTSSGTVEFGNTVIDAEGDPERPLTQEDRDCVLNALDGPRCKA